MIPSYVGVPVGFTGTDDVALIFLKDQRNLDAAIDNLNRSRHNLMIDNIIPGNRPTYLRYSDPKTDPTVPDIIVRPQAGIIYTTNTAKIAEHGGLTDYDRKVACFASATNLQKMVFDHQIHTTKFAPTILQPLGLDPNTLKGVVTENTKVIDGF